MRVNSMSTRTTSGRMQVATVTRRQFLGGAAASVSVMSSGTLHWGVLEAERVKIVRWQDDVRRIGQLNFNEVDPLTLDVAAWSDYWASLKMDALVIGFGGIMATYPTQIPFHHRSEFLGTRDLTGEFVTAARKRGMRVIARIDCNYAYQDALETHPEWFMRRKDGAPRLEMEAAYLFKTCQFSSYFTEQMPAIYREIGQRYAPDALFTNGWPGTSAIEMCYCRNCQTIYREAIGEVPPAMTDARSEAYRKFYAIYMKRVVEIWKLWDGIARESKPEALFFGDLGGAGMQMIKDIKPIGDVSAWYAGDHQGRVGDTPLWSCAAQGRIAQSVMDGKKASNIVAGWSYNSPRYRHSSNPTPEMDLWLAQTTACGMAPWQHWLGGSPRDKRWEEPAHEFFAWMSANDAHFCNLASLANIAVLYPQSTLAFYQSDGTSERKINGSAIDPEDYLQGLYYALLEGRFVFDFVHQEKLSADSLRRYRALLIPNAAYLSDTQCEAIVDYAKSGGSVLATFETSRYNEWGDQRGDFGLHELFGVSCSAEFPGNVIGPAGNSYMEIRAKHPALAGFDGTEMLPGPEYRVPVTPMSEGEAQLTVIPHYMNAMPELIFPRVARTDQPAGVFRELNSSSRIAYFPGDIDRTAWRSGHPDFTRLIANSVRWLMGSSPMPVTVEGKGLIEVFAWKTEPGFALHILNYTNPNMLRAAVREIYPVGPLSVSFNVPAGRKITRVQLLKVQKNLPFKYEGATVRFEIESVADYEVVALT